MGWMRRVAEISRQLGALKIPLHFTAELRVEGIARIEAAYVGAAVHVSTAGKLFAKRIHAIRVAPDPIAELAVTRAFEALGPIYSDENANPVIVTVSLGYARRSRATTTLAFLEETFAPAVEVKITRLAITGFAAAVAEPLALDGALALRPQTGNHGAEVDKHFTAEPPALPLPGFVRRRDGVAFIFRKVLAKAVRLATGRGSAGVRKRVVVDANAIAGAEAMRVVDAGQP